jgi:hypothetical protein
MTEPEWLASTDPHAMLAFLGDTASPRKLRLFAVSQARRLRRHFEENYNYDRDARKLVVLAERVADGQVKARRLENIAEEEGRARAWCFFPQRNDAPCHDGNIDGWAFTDLAYACIIENASDAASTAVAIMVKRPVRHKVKERLLAGKSRWERPLEECKYQGVGGTEYWHVAKEAEASFAPVLEPPARAEQCRWLREIFGNPFRPPQFDPTWLSADASTLASTMYDQRRFDGMPVLADALEEAGCTEQAILKHCRSKHKHARGCWLLDLLLARK